VRRRRHRSGGRRSAGWGGAAAAAQVRPCGGPGEAKPQLQRRGERGVQRRRGRLSPLRGGAGGPAAHPPRGLPPARGGVVPSRARGTEVPQGGPALLSDGGAARAGLRPAQLPGAAAPAASGFKVRREEAGERRGVGRGWGQRFGWQPGRR